MAFWCRIKQSQLKSLSNQFKRCYFQIHGPCSFNSTASHTRIWVLDRPTSVFHKSQFEFGKKVRFFAAPVQVKPKQEEKNTSGPRLNEQISSLYVRLVSDEGHGIVSRHEALERARRLKLDLVEVQRSANPPVCKLVDYHREKYKQQVKDKDRSKSKSEVTLRKGDCKEVRFAGKIEKKDLQMKADMVKRLMERGYRVKCMAMGTEDQDLGGLLARLSALIEDVSVVESGPRMEKKLAYVIVRHVKYGPSKKGTLKKLSEVNMATVTNVQKVSVSSPNINPSAQRPLRFEGNSNGAESGLETDDDILSEEVPTSPSLEMPDEDPAKNKSTWSVLDASDDFDEVFDFRNDLNGVAFPETSSSPKNSFARVISTEPVLDFTRTPTSSPTPSDAPLGIDNRYRRESRNRFPPPPTKQINVNPPDAIDSRRLQTQFPNQRGHPQFDLSTSSPSGETKHGETDVSMVRNLKLPANEFSKKETSRPVPSFGLFSAPEANSIPRKQSAPTEVNRYKKGANPIRNSESQAKLQR